MKIETQSLVYRRVPPQTEIKRLAYTFARLLDRGLTPTQKRYVLQHHGGASCSTHDVCDPNEVMDDALRSIGMEPDSDSIEQTLLINRAWTYAREKGFWLKV